jgi:hypothetical protein
VQTTNSIKLIFKSFSNIIFLIFFPSFYFLLSWQNFLLFSSIYHKLPYLYHLVSVFGFISIDKLSVLWHITSIKICNKFVKIFWILVAALLSRCTTFQISSSRQPCVSTGRRVICYSIQGTPCLKGINCFFAHGQSELRKI